MTHEEEIARQEKEIAEQMVKIEQLKEALKGEKESLATMVENYRLARGQSTLDITKEPEKEQPEEDPHPSASSGEKKPKKGKKKEKPKIEDEPTEELTSESLDDIDLSDLNDERLEKMLIAMEKMKNTKTRAANKSLVQKELKRRKDNDEHPSLAKDIKEAERKAKLEEKKQRRTCGECGTEVPENELRCPKCNEEYTEPEKEVDSDVSN